MTFCINCTLPLQTTKESFDSLGFCVCQSWSKHDSSNISLSQHGILFQPLERQKRSSTGRLISRLTDIQTDSWHRLKNTDQAARFNDYKLVYPSTEGHPSLSPQPQDKLLLIDGTWQQSKKMMRQSNWLQELPRVSFSTEYISQYSLRRNQQEQGTSTLEALALCLIEQGHNALGKDLIDFLTLFQQAYLQARQAGRFSTGFKQ